ncbi:hypothetical protein M3661_03920 [Paenibacillus sp. MER 180]|uniref:hypothetical protein n=1 Tax=Paenibacillus sp. MER 180 TaxID=2939570 RepID=UPI00203E9E30|nr:hypothetical protein [Paenibacillus sp. MER 180]MCM3289271.1 hypothetical protein [Paenibacillus sp. MER 180]
MNIGPKTLGLYVDGENKESTQAIKIYGTTYDPVRDVAKFINIAITPDLKRNSPYIGSEPTQKRITFDEAVKLVKKSYDINLDRIDDNKYVIQVYEIVIDNPKTGEGHTTTFGWYYVDKITKEVTSMFD